MAEAIFHLSASLVVDLIEFGIDLTLLLQQTLDVADSTFGLGLISISFPSSQWYILVHLLAQSCSATRTSACQQNYY